MSLSDVTEKVNHLGNAWEHFKRVNDERLSQIEKKGAADPLTVDQLNKINNAMDSQKSRLSRVETTLSRPQFEVKGQRFESEEEMEYKNAFSSYIRRGIDNEIANLELKALTTDTGSGSYGGYLVTPNMQRLISGNLEKNSIMRKICSVQEISTSALDVIDDDDTFGTTWAASETASVSDSTTTTMLKKTIAAHELVAQPQVTQKLIDDSAIDMEEWLAKRLAETFLEAEENAFINGTGSAQPTGILNYSHGTTSSTIEHTTSAESVDGTFTVEELLNLYYSLDEKYINKASFLTSRAMVQKIRTLKDASNDYIWQPGILAGQDDMLLGVPVYQNSFVPAPGDATKSLILGDFSQYQIVDRADVRILRDPFTSKPYVRFYTTKRVGGDVTRTEAFKVLVLGSDGA